MEAAGLVLLLLPLLLLLPVLSLVLLLPVLSLVLMGPLRSAVLALTPSVMPVLLVVEEGSVVEVDRVRDHSQRMALRQEYTAKQQVQQLGSGAQDRGALLARTCSGRWVYEAGPWSTLGAMALWPWWRSHSEQQSRLQRPCVIRVRI